MEEVHSSVFLKTNPPQVTKCTACCSLFHCPLCPTRRYRPQTTEAKVLQHLEVHKKKSVQYEDFYITRCHQACRTGGCHFHCPFCRKTIMRREDTEKHLTKCRPQPVFQVEDCLLGNKKQSDEPIPDRRDDTSDDSSRQEEDCKESFRLILEENDSRGREDDSRGREDSCSPGLDSPPFRVQQAIKSTTRTSICQHCNVEILTKNMKKHIYRRHADTAVRDTHGDSHHRDASVPRPTASLRGRAARPTVVEAKGPKRRTGQHPEKNGYHKRLLEELDEDEYFFLSLVPACKRMAPRKKAQLKLSIMQMVAQAEFEDTDDGLL